MNGPAFKEQVEAILSRYRCDDGTYTTGFEHMTLREFLDDTDRFLAKIRAERKQREETRQRIRPLSYRERQFARLRKIGCGR